MDPRYAPAHTPSFVESKKILKLYYASRDHNLGLKDYITDTCDREISTWLRLMLGEYSAPAWPSANMCQIN